MAKKSKKTEETEETKAPVASSSGVVKTEDGAYQDTLLGASSDGLSAGPASFG